ncbi:MAG: poly(3-hydroxybutyrate) depolymerase [Myxococcota bacterium]|jgi:poly(3-hydroxybutyrate) depolymerase
METSDGTGPTDATDTSDATELTDATETSDPPSNVHGTFDQELTHDGQTREFIVYVPESAVGTTPAPVVLMFHGTAQDGKFFADQGTWQAVADTEGIIVVWPTALHHCYLKDDDKDGQFTDAAVSTKWANSDDGHVDVFPICPPEVIANLDEPKKSRADHPLADDVGFVDAMLSTLQANLAIDAKRVYATGFSNGSGFVLRLMGQRSGVFAAFASNAGSPVAEPAPDAVPRSLWWTVGSKDSKVFGPTAEGPDGVPMKEELMSTPALKAKFTDPVLPLMQLADEYTFKEQQNEGLNIITWTWAKSTGDASNTLTFNLVEDQGHTYPEYTPMVLWNFFKDQSL